MDNTLFEQVDLGTQTPDIFSQHLETKLQEMRYAIPDIEVLKDVIPADNSFKVGIEIPDNNNNPVSLRFYYDTPVYKFWWINKYYKILDMLSDRFEIQHDCLLDINGVAEVGLPLDNDEASINFIFFYAVKMNRELAVTITNSKSLRAFMYSRYMDTDSRESLSMGIRLLKSLKERFVSTGHADKLRNISINVYDYDIRVIKGYTIDDAIRIYITQANSLYR